MAKAVCTTSGREEVVEGEGQKSYVSATKRRSANSRIPTPSSSGGLHRAVLIPGSPYSRRHEDCNDFAAACCRFVMQPSEDEIQREVEALRDLRRRSTAQGGPGALILDPDLPAQTSPTSPHSAYFSGGNPSHDDSSSSSHEDSNTDSSGDDPFHLFWVPARLHPEIAPDQFRAFLKEHAVEGAVNLSRSSSVSSVSSLGRKKSMLSRQYRPTENDGVESEEIVPLRRNRSSFYANTGPQLTMHDLQKLEELAEEASKSDDPSKLRSVLRRSLSLNVAPTIADQMDDMPNMGDEADAPIIVPPPGQILRRAARTKIRKPGQKGEGSHRFQATRRGPGRAATQDPRSSSDLSSNDHGELESPIKSRPPTTEISEPTFHRPESYSEEASIFDAYITDEPEFEPEAPIIVTSPPPQVESITLVQSREPEPEYQPPPVTVPILHHPQPKRLVVPPSDSIVSGRSPSPDATSQSGPTSEGGATKRPSPSPEPPAFLSTSPTPSQLRSPSPTPQQPKDDKARPGKKPVEKPGKKEKEKEKKSGFFGSLFGGKKKQEEQAPSNIGLGSGRETAAALLGASKSSKSPAPSPSPQPGGPYARYPIHVERAIYRLSHIKLANPRRPLYEQVLISNLMFWYLGVINKAQTQAASSAAAQTGAAGQGQQQSSPTEKEQREREQREREEREKGESERMEREKDRDRVEPKAQSRRGGLTKPAAGTPGNGSRKAEMPVRGPQYEMQHRAMEQEYVGGPSTTPMARTSSAPPTAGSSSYQGGYSRGPQSLSPQYSGPSASQQQPQIPNSFYYDSAQNPDGQQKQQPTNGPRRSRSPGLPPGAMQPVAVDGWSASDSASPPPPSRSPNSISPPRDSSSSNAPSSSAYSNPRQSRSPPPQNRYTPVQDTRSLDGMTPRPTRSMSATAAPPNMPAVNGKIKKVSSAHAVAPHRPRTSDGGEEDVPLALYQQQRRR